MLGQTSHYQISFVVLVTLICRKLSRYSTKYITSLVQGIPDISISGNQAADTGRTLPVEGCGLNICRFELLYSREIKPLIKQLILSACFCLSLSLSLSPLSLSVYALLVLLSLPLSCPLYLYCSLSASMSLCRSHPHVLKTQVFCEVQQGQGFANKAHTTVSWAPTTRLP